MTLEEFTRDVVPIISMILSTGALVFVGIQLRVATTSLKQNSSWNKVHATYTFFDLQKNIQLEHKALSILEKQGIVIDGVITSEDALKVYLDRKMRVSLEIFLNDLECYAGAYQVGALDKEISYHLHSDRLVRKYERYLNYLLVYREQSGSNAGLLEFEKLALNWKESLKNEDTLAQKSQNLAKQKELEGGLQDDKSL